MSRLNPRFPRAWLRVITLGVLIALTVVGVSTTQAQSSVTFVSNHNQPVVADFDHYNTNIIAQKFETGTSGNGYAVGSIRLKVQKGPTVDLTTAPPFVTIKKPSAGDGNVPGDLVGTLTNPTSITDGREVFFTADPPIHLDPNLSYFIVINEDVGDPENDLYPAIVDQRLGAFTTTSGLEDSFRDAWNIDDVSWTKPLLLETNPSWTANLHAIRLGVLGENLPDNTLRLITLTDSNDDFVAVVDKVDVSDYTLTVTARIGRLTIAVEPNDPDATVVITDDDFTDTPLTARAVLTHGETYTFTITVTPDDTDGVPRVYTVAVTRPEALPTSRNSLCPTYSVWCSTMQVGHGSTITSNPRVRRDEYGYLLDNLNFGDLNKKSFFNSGIGETFTIGKLLYVRTEEGNPNELVISHSLLLWTDVELDPEWTLFVDGETYTIEPTTATGGYFTYRVDLAEGANAAQLEEGELVSVGLVEPSPQLSLSQSNEGLEGSLITFTVTLEGSAPFTQISASLVLSIESDDGATFDSSAPGGADLDRSTKYVTFLLGDKTPKAITVETYQDAVAEDDETFTATLASLRNAVLAEGEESAKGRILNDDDAVGDLPALSVSLTGGMEGDTAVAQVELDKVSGRSVWVDYEFTGTSDAASATVGMDFDATSGTLILKPGELISKTVDLPLDEDFVDEDDFETFSFTISNVVNATAPDSLFATATIEDIDDPPELYIEGGEIFGTSYDPTATEGQYLEFVVYLLDPSGKVISFQYTITAGTATENVDYDATGSGTETVEIAPGEKDQIVRVRTYVDGVDDDGETLTVTLLNPMNATLGVPGLYRHISSTGTIINGMGIEVPTDLTATVPENGGSVTLRWSLTSFGALAPTGFQYRYRPKLATGYDRNYSRDWTTVSGGSGARSMVITGSLVNNAEYEFQVKGIGNDDAAADIDTETYRHSTRDC